MRQYKFVLSGRLAGWQAGGCRPEAEARKDFKVDMVPGAQIQSDPEAQCRATNTRKPPASRPPGLQPPASSLPASSLQPAACSLPPPAPAAFSLQPPASGLPPASPTRSRGPCIPLELDPGKMTAWRACRGTVDREAPFVPLCTAHIPQGPLLLPPDGDQQLAASQEGGLIAQRLTCDTHVAGRGDCHAAHVERCDEGIEDVLCLACQVAQSLHGFGDPRIVVAFQGGQQLVPDTIAGELDQRVRGIGPHRLLKIIQVTLNFVASEPQQGTNDGGQQAERRIRGIPARPARPVPRTMRCRIVST